MTTLLIDREALEKIRNLAEDGEGDHMAAPECCKEIAEEVAHATPLWRPIAEWDKSLTTASITVFWLDYIRGHCSYAAGEQVPEKILQAADSFCELPEE